jgi:hypothetical protein
MAFVVRFSTRGVQKHHKNLFGGKVEKMILSYFPFDFFNRQSRFWPFLCMRSPKTPPKHQKFSKNLKKRYNR